MTISVKAPLRLTIAGGGTDLPAFYNQEHAQFGVCLNFAINKHVLVTLTSSSDLGSSDPIVKAVSEYYDYSGGIIVSSSLPMGTGLGSSSALTVACIKALSLESGLNLSAGEVAELACKIEIDILNAPIGKQDQYAASYGQASVLLIHTNGMVHRSPISINSVIKNFQLFYLGGSRSASKILKQQSTRSEENLKTLLKIRALAIEAITGSPSMRKREKVAQLGRIIKESWELKKTLADGISNSIVDSKISAALEAGAIGAKLVGAGSTGFLLTIAQEEDKGTISQAFSDLLEIPVELDQFGARLYNP